MATLNETFTNIANAIRTKGSTTAKITPANMPQAITDLPSGGGDFNFVQEWAKANNNSLDSLFSGFKGTSVDKFIKFNDTSSVTDTSRMFSNCYNLTSIPQLDTSSAINMSYMFFNCSNLTSIPALDTSSATNMSNMFRSCSNLTSIPALDTSSATNMSNMFENCSNLTSIPALDTSSVTNMNYMFSSCTNLEEINMININAYLSIKSCKKMQQPALHKLIDNLLPQTSTKTLTMGETLLARVSEEYKQKAVDKGRTLA